MALVPYAVAIMTTWVVRYTSQGLMTIPLWAVVRGESFQILLSSKMVVARSVIWSGVVWVPG